MLYLRRLPSETPAPSYWIPLTWGGVNLYFPNPQQAAEFAAYMTDPDQDAVFWAAEFGAHVPSCITCDCALCRGEEDGSGLFSSYGPNHCTPCPHCGSFAACMAPKWANTCPNCCAHR